MFKSLYRIQQHPDRRLGEAVLNARGALIMVLLFISEEFIALGINVVINYINLYLGCNLGSIELNLFTDLFMLALLVFFFGRFFWINLKNLFNEFKAVYIVAPILCYVGSIFCNYIVQVILIMIRGTAEQTTNNEIVMDMVSEQPFTLVFMTVILAPIIEESVFRAGLCRSMTASKNYFVKSLGFVISVFVFSLMHVYQYAFFATDASGATYLTFNADEFISILMYIPMSIGFAVCSYVCKNFWGSVICHMITNCVAMSLMILLSLLNSYMS